MIQNCASSQATDDHIFFFSGLQSTQFKLEMYGTNIPLKKKIVLQELTQVSKFSEYKNILKYEKEH